MLFIEYPKCSTCKKAKKWLDDNGACYHDRNIVNENPTKEELKTWFQKSDYPLKRFFNTSGILYKEYGLAKKLPSMSEEEQLDLLASNGMLVKRPILICDNQILVGFKEEEWKKIL